MTELINYSLWTNAHIDNMIAMQIMGWQSGPWGWDKNGKFLMLFEQWNPTVDVEQANQVLDKITNRKDLAKLEITAYPKSDNRLTWYCYIHVHEIRDYVLEDSTTWQRALCQAALRIEERKNNGEENDPT